MFLSTKFDDSEILITTTKDSGTTGNFEVTIDGVLVHSKKGGKAKKCESDEERAALENAINEMLK